MKVALIAGAGGAASKRLIEVLLADPDWSVIGLARTPRRATVASAGSQPTCPIGMAAAGRSRGIPR